MSHIMITGAFGNVGRSAIAAALEEGHDLTAFDRPSRANLAYAKSLAARPAKGKEGSFRFVAGDIRDAKAVEGALQGQEALIHLAAIIPPAADKAPELARDVNIGGTERVLEALARVPGCRLVFSSSVATYGDRVVNYWIKADDPLAPCEDDGYARTKVACETLIRGSGLPFSILRLSYIVWKKKLACDPLMFRMPPATRIEVCHTKDCGRALVHAAFAPAALSKTFNIGGGPSCRTSFRVYLDRMMALFGLGDSSFLPDEAFSPKGYHCGWMDSDKAQAALAFQGTSLEDYYEEVRIEARPTRFFASIAAPLVKRMLLAASPYLPWTTRRLHAGRRVTA